MSRRVLRQANWLVLDQVASSISNIIVTVVVANLAEPAVFGVFGVIYLGVAVVLAVIRGGGGELLLFRVAEAGSANRTTERAPQTPPGQDSSPLKVSVGRPDIPHPDRIPEPPMGPLLTVSLVLGVGAAAVTVIASIVAQPGLRPLLWSFAGAFLVIPTQDSIRFVFFARRQPERAFVIDVVWIAGLMSGLAGLWWLKEVSAARAVTLWALAAALSGLIGLLMARIRPTRDGILNWFAEDALRVIKLAVDPLIGTGAAYVLMQGLVLISGPETTAALTGAALIFQPLNTALAGLRWGVLRPLRLMVIERPRDVMPLAWKCFALCVIATAVWYGIVQLMETPLLTIALGDTAALTKRVMGWFFVLTAVRSGTLIFGDITRAAAPERRLLRTRLGAAAIMIVAAWSGTLVNPTTGAAIGWTAGATLVGIIIWPRAASIAINDTTRVDPIA